MKNLSVPKLRITTAAAVALSAALALSACTPPHQNDSEQSFKDNQTGQATPMLNEPAESESSVHSSAVAPSGTVDPGYNDLTSGATQETEVVQPSTQSGAGSH